MRLHLFWLDKNWKKRGDCANNYNLIVDMENKTYKVYTNAFYGYYHPENIEVKKKSDIEDYIEYLKKKWIYGNGVIYMLKAINIKWDTDGDMEVFNELPTEMIITDELEEMYKKDREYALEEISDWLSDETGFCHAGFEIEKVITKESVENNLYDFFNDKMETGDASEIESVGRYSDMYVTRDNGIVIDCVGGKQIKLIIQVD